MSKDTTSGTDTTSEPEIRPLVLDLSIRDATATINVRGEQHGQEKKLGVDLNFAMQVELAELTWTDDYAKELIALYYGRGKALRSHTLPNKLAFEGISIGETTEETKKDQHVMHFAASQLPSLVKKAQAFDIRRVTKLKLEMGAGRQYWLHGQIQLTVTKAQVATLASCLTEPISIGITPKNEDLFNKPRGKHGKSKSK